ncbi:helix-turn-helix domain-containing protein [Eubacteriaceae bacterium ES3]|nr:helix-turn-helix domain-containing protein [Eubacteriaceae bacterium ES3]
MTITFSQIYHPFNKNFRLINPAPERNIIGSGRISRKCNRLSPDYLYVGKTTQLPPAEKLYNCNLVLLEDKAIDLSYYEISSLNMLITDNPLEFKKIQDKIRDIFELQLKINNYAYNLLNLCQNGASIQEILDTGYKTLNNPMMLFNTSFGLLAHAGTQYVQNEPLLERTIEKGYQEKEFLDKILDESALNPDHQNIIIKEKGILNHSLITGKIVRNNQLLGYLELFECNKPVSDINLQQLSLLCQFLSIALIETTSKNLAGNTLIESFLTDLLENRIQGQSAIEERANLFNLVLYDSMVAITVAYNDILHNPEKIYLLKKKLQNHFNKHTVVVFEHRIVILFDSKNSASPLSLEELDRFEAILKEDHCIAGISLPFSSIAKFHKHYKQSLACIEIMRRLNYASPLLKYDDCKTTHMMLHYSDICDLEGLVCDEVKLLFACDNDKGSELADTLFFFARNRQDITATAKKMNLHYNTIKYRINQIVELTDIDFDDPRKMYDIIVSDQALNLIKQIDSIKESRV